MHSRDGVEQRYLLIKPDSPQAAINRFAGGKGALNLANGPFDTAIG